MKIKFRIGREKRVGKVLKIYPHEKEVFVTCKNPIMLANGSLEKKWHVPLEQIIAVID